MNRYSFYIASAVIYLVYGMAAEKYKLFPSPQLHFIVDQARLALGEISGDNDWYYVDAKVRKRIAAYQPAAVQPGLTMITGLDKDHQLTIKVIDMLGEVIHQWEIDWYEIWPDATHIPEHLMPKGKPGTHIHGAKLMENGDVVFNFENLGLVRLDACGNTVFKTPYPTHHAINVDTNGDFWVPGQIYHQQSLADYPYYQAPFKDDTVIKLSKDGKVLTEVSVMKILKDNGYEGLMYLSTLNSRKLSITGDVYHLNDVEVFPDHMKEGIFKHGDVMVSLRNINTIFIYDPNTLKIRFLSTGKFVRQHDPDFIDGNTFSVYDNNHVAPAKSGQSSKIVIVSALDDSVTSYLNESDKLPFFSNIMGKHQWLNNGNLLILESMNGRVLEVSPQKQLVWSYNNLISQTGKVSIMEGSERLATSFDDAFFQQKTAACRQ